MSDTPSELWSVVQTLQELRNVDELSQRQKRRLKSIIADVDALRKDIKRDEVDS